MKSWPVFAAVGIVILAAVVGTFMNWQPKGGTAMNPPTAGANGAGGRPAEQPGEKEAPKIPKEMTAPALNHEIFKPEPLKSNGWKEAGSTFAQLGEKMDGALADLKSALGHADTVWDVGGATMMSRGDIKVKDGQTFSVDYYTPGTQATRNRIISDGSKRFAFYEEKWQEKPLPTARKTDPITDAKLEAWPKDFYKLMFENFEEDRNVWKPLMDALASGRGGFQASIEQKTEKVFEKDRQIYRVVATRKSDGAEFQITVDGIRFLPLTIKSLVKNSKGGQDKRFWTCQWAFNGPFTATDFIVPTRP